MPKLVSRESCTGCSACAAACPKNCIQMTADADGFAAPVIDLEICVGCGLCERVCPVMKPLPKAERSPKAYAAYSKDEAMRLQSSSGGVFTELARLILNQGGAVFGAAYDEAFRVVHICAESEAELARLRGAKYAQSELGDTFRQVKERLDRGQAVLFSGTPCQVGGLKSFLRKDYKNLILVDFVCHSVPSPMAWEEYVKLRARLDNAGEAPERINLRSKETGWSRYQYSNLLEYAEGKRSVLKTHESLYMKLFVGGYISRGSCADCRFKGYARVSDLTVGDFWGIWNVAPEMDDNKGTSVVLVQSERGERLFAELGERLTVKPLSLDEASCENPAMIRTSRANEKRKAAFEYIRSGRLNELEAWFKPEKPTLTQRMKRFAKRVFRRLFSK